MFAGWRPNIAAERWSVHYHVCARARVCRVRVRGVPTSVELFDFGKAQHNAVLSARQAMSSMDTVA